MDRRALFALLLIAAGAVSAATFFTARSGDPRASVEAAAPAGEATDSRAPVTLVPAAVLEEERVVNPVSNETVDVESERVAVAALESDLDKALGWLRRTMPERFTSFSAKEMLAITELDLRGMDVTDDDLRHLGAFPDLHRLSLRQTPVTDAGLVHLHAIEKLDFLELRSTQVTGEGLPLIPQSLELLKLCDTQVTGADLYRLPPMPDLEVLKLNFLELDDAAIEALNVYPSLKHIELDESQITEDGLRRLLELNPNLQRVEIRRVRIDGDTVDSLREDYPSCDFAFDARAFR